MSKRKEATPVEHLILRMAADHPFVTTGEIAAAARVTRQAAHYHAKRMVANGLLTREGAGRGSRYLLASDLARAYRLEGLEEHVVWSELEGSIPTEQTSSEAVRIATYAFTEMLNNAIDHSGGTSVLVRAWFEGAELGFEVGDDGVGAFRSIRERMDLPDEWAALQELVKGKATTAPEAHSGEGIFFTSKAVDRFELEDPSLRWIVDNGRRDQAVGESARGKGTRVRFDISKRTGRTLAEVFDAFAPEDEQGFSTSRVPIRLFEIGTGFVSRSEARRVAHRLERFRRVELDFSGVDELGQGFADELFRVWPSRHPEVRLEPTNMSAVVARVVDRARAERA
jgi:anti-sigma regulatory factor (Ser/Thr protein kinase)